MRTVFGSTIAPRARVLFSLLLSLFIVIAFQVSLTSDADAGKRKRYSAKKVSKAAKRKASRKRARASKRRRTRRARRARRASGHNPRYAAIVVDAKTGKVLFSRHANARRYPASLTKMMTLYLVFEDLKAGRIKKSTRLVMTKAGARRVPSKIGLRPGQSISMEQAILSLVTKSANDVATALGDQLAGSEARFAQRMTRKARQLGMKNTTFKNANGLTASGQVTTAADMATLGLALREHFPRRYKYFNTRVFKLGRRRYGNHNRLLGRVRGVDGIKTGYTRASGFNLVSSVSSRNRRIVAVVMGGRSGASRNAHMKQLISRHLRKASTGKSRRLVASARSSYGSGRSAVAAQTADAQISQKASKLIANRIRVAHSYAPAPAGAKDGGNVAEVQKKLVALASKSTPKPFERPAIDPITTAAPVATSKSRWQIQIAASDDREKLLELMQEVRKKNTGLLSDTKLFTPSVKRNGSTFYRGRFVGFKSKEAANRACKTLKRQKVSCLALSS